MLIVTTPLRYLRPNHHPNKEGSTELAQQYLRESPAAQKARAVAEEAANSD
jgi:hypothetical protein